MTRHWRVPAYIGLVVVLSPVGSGPSQAKKKTAISIQPGPTTISAAEASIQADLDAGIEHAVILLEEIARNENLGTEMQTTYHLRAKILSNEGRDLANIELPYLVGDSRLREWWARTIQPDGTVIELTRENIDEQFLGSAGSREVRARKAALPGVGPGSIIDYGYEIREAGYIPIDRIELQRQWYVKELRYRWEPYGGLPGAYAVSGPQGLDVDIQQDNRSVLITARGLPPVPSEPLMPPRHQTHAAVTLYYIEQDQNPKNFWDLEAKRNERRLREDLDEHRPRIREAIAQCGAEGSLIEQLRAAYTWVQESDLTGRDADSVYAGIARGFGAHANLVMASDRRIRFWNSALKRLDQFDTQVVALSLGSADGAVLIAPSTTLGFGELPWWITGGNGLVATEKGAKSIFLPPSEARDSIAATDAHVGFSDDGVAVETSWKTMGQGQVGLAEKHMVNELPEEGRQDFVDALCGVGPNSEVVQAEMIGLDDPRANYELACKLELFDTPAYDKYDIFRMSFRGPWLGHVVELPEGKRTHSIVFDYARVDLAKILVEAPSGFTPGQPPEPQRLESPYGRYQLSVKKRGNAFLVERAFALLVLTVPAGEYDALREYLGDVHRTDETPLQFVRAKDPS